MEINKKQIFLVLFLIFIIVIVIVIFLFKKNSLNNLELKNNIKNEDSNMLLKEDSGDYYKSNTRVSTPLPKNFEKKLIEEGKISEMFLKFNSGGFLDKKYYKFNLQTNIKISIDAGETGLPEGTILKLSIPGASFESDLRVPGRYTYGIYFKNNGNQEIILSGDGLQDGKISKTIIIK